MRKLTLATIIALLVFTTTAFAAVDSNRTLDAEHKAQGWKEVE